VPLPADFTTRTVYETFFEIDGQLATGTISFTPNYPMIRSTGGVVLRDTIYANITSGELSVVVPDTDSGESPEGWSYLVRLTTVTTRKSWIIQVPAGGTPLRLPLPVDSTVPTLTFPVPGPEGPPGPTGPQGPPGSGSGASVQLPIFDVTDYGAIGDGSTDDYLAVKAAMDALIASGESGWVYFPFGEYVVNVTGRVTRSGNTYAALRWPDRDPQLPKVAWGFLGVGDPQVTRTNPEGGNPAGMIQTASILRATYDPASYSWSSTDKLPSLIAGPDRDIVGADGNHFSNIHAMISNLIIRQPVNPSLCAANFQGVSTASVRDVRIDVNSTLNSIPEPTRPTGASLLLPDSNNNVNNDVDRILIEGHYTGVPVSELCFVREATAYRCKIGIAIPSGGQSHGCHLGHINVQQVPWVIAGYSPSGVGPNLGIVPATGTVLWIDWLDVEDYDYAGDVPWMYAPGLGAHIYASSDLRGQISAFYRVNPGSVSESGGPVRTDLFANGGSGLAVYAMTGGGTASTKKATTRVPENPVTDPPGVPGSVVATAGVESASVAFSPADGTATGFRVLASTGETATGSASPIVVSGLAADVSVTFRVRGENTAGNSAYSSASNAVVPTASGGSDLTLWADTDFGSIGFSDTDVTIGTEVRAAESVSIIGLRWYRPTTNNSGAVTGAVWSVDDSSGLVGTLITGTDVTFSVSGTGWQEALFADPVVIPAGEYRGGVNLPNGWYISIADYFDSGPGSAGIENGPLLAPHALGAGGATADMQGSFHSGGGLSLPDVKSPSEAFYGVDFIYSEV
jgi:hypothetical protein